MKDKMPKYMQLFIVFLLFLSFVPIGARTDEVLTWEDCVKEAKKNHPDLVSAEEKLNQAKANKAINVSNLLPQITSEVSEKTSKTATQNKADRYSYSVTGKQLIFDGFQTRNDINAASETIKSTQYSYGVTSSDVRLSLRTAFVELLKAQEFLTIKKDIAKRREQNLELVKLRYNAGREHKGSLLNAQANLAQAEFEFAQAKRNTDLAQRQLTKELGRKKLTSIRVKGDFEIKSSDQQKPDFERLAESNPFLQKLIAQKESTRFSLKSAKADFFPKVYANASVGGTNSEWLPNNEEWSVGVSLSLPIFEGGSRIAEVSKAKAEFNQAQADERSGRNSVILTLEETWKELQDAIDKVKVEQKFLEAAQERAKITQAQYSIGLISFDNWSIIEDNLVNAKKTLLDAKANALIAQAKWIQAKGITLDYDKK